MRAFLSAAFVVLALTGCTSVIYPEARPSYLEFPERLPVKVALELPEGFEEYVWSGTASSWVGSGYTGHFHIGQPTAVVLRDTLSKVAIFVTALNDSDVAVYPEIKEFTWSDEDESSSLKRALLSGLVGSAAELIEPVNGKYSSTFRLIIFAKTGGHGSVCSVGGAGTATSRLSPGSMSMDEQEMRLREASSNAISAAVGNAVRNLVTECGPKLVEAASDH